MKHSIINTLLLGIPSPRTKAVLTCEPVTISMGVMAAASAAMAIKGQSDARKVAKGTEEARRIEQENVITENRRRATDDYLNSTRLEADQQSQEEAAVALKSSDVMRETRRSVATGNASAAERGVAGRTINDIAADFDFMSNEETGRLKQNQALANQQHQESVRGYKTQFSNRVADVKPYVPKSIAPVDYFGPIFQAGSQTLGAAARPGAIADMKHNLGGSTPTPKASSPQQSPFYVPPRKDYVSL